MIQADEGVPLPDSYPEGVEFEQVIPHKMRFLKLAFERFQKMLVGELKAQFEQFCQEQFWWLDDFVLFMALLEANGGKS